MPKGTIAHLGYRWSCGRCDRTAVFVPVVENDLVVDAAIDQADRAGWRQTERYGWVCPPHARGMRSLRHTFDEVPDAPAR